MLSNPKASFSLSAISAKEYESLHCPASSTLGIWPIVPNGSLLYRYFAHPAVRMTVSFGSFSANSV